MGVWTFPGAGEWIGETMLFRFNAANNLIELLVGRQVVHRMSLAEFRATFGQAALRALLRGA